MSLFLIGSEFVELSGSNCGGLSCRYYWDTYVINPLRSSYPNLTLTYAANATNTGDEFATVGFWDQVDILGVDGYFDLTGQADPTVAQLVSAWTSSPAQGGLSIVQALEKQANQHDKPLVFMEIGYKSTSGANEQPWNYSLKNGYDPTEQANCYEAFFEVFSTQTSWMKGVFWWDWTISPPAANDQDYSPQDKPAGTTVLPEWFGAASPGFTLSAHDSSLTLGQGLGATETIAIAAQGGFSAAVSLAASGLPSGVTANFSSGSGAGTQVLTLTASPGAAIGGPATVTITGTSGSLTSSTTISLSVTAAALQTISFANPGSQSIGTRLTLAATSSSGLAIAYDTTTNGVCTVNSSEAIATMIASGTCIIDASQAGNGVYTAAAAVTQSFQVTTLAPVSVPASAEAVVYQLNWLAALGGEALVSESPAGSSFGVTSNGYLAVADTQNLVLYNTQTGAATTLGAWPNASAVAIDPSNNLYVADLYGTVNGIVKLPYIGGAANGGYAAFTTPAAGLATCTGGSMVECQLPANVGTVAPGAMAFDASGNLFWQTASVGASGGNGIWECTAACLSGTGSPVEIYQEPTASTAPSSSSGQLLIGGLALDSAGNLFFTDSSIYVDPTSSAITSFYSELNELPIGTGVGYGGAVTGYAASPIVLYTMAPTAPGPYDDELDSVAVQRSATGGDTVYFTDKDGGVYAFPDTAGGIPLSNGRPAALYMVAAQGGKSLNIDSQGNLYLSAYSSTRNTAGADTMAQITLDKVSVPASPVGSAASPSAMLNPVYAMVNDATCTGTPVPSLAFVANASATGSAILAAGGDCYSFPGGSSRIDVSASFTPLAAGPGSDTLIAADQSGDTAIVTVSSAGTGFTLSAASTSLTVTPGGNNTDAITVADAGGFAGAVTLRATGLPSGVTASFASNPASSSSTLTLTAAGTASPGGPVTLTITGVSGALTETTTIALTVTGPPAFTLGSPALTVARGSTTGNTGTIAVTPANGFAGTINLGCAVDPQAGNDQPTCSLSPANLIFPAASTGPQTATLTIYTVAPTTAQNRIRQILWPSAGGTALALVFFVWIPRRRRNCPAMLGLLAMLFTALGMTGCTSQTIHATPDAGTPAGTYHVTVTGTSGSIWVTTQVTVTVR